MRSATYNERVDAGSEFRHEKRPPVLSGAPRRAARIDARARRRRPRARADRARGRAQPRFALSVSATTAISITCPGFPEPEAVVALVAGPDGDKHVLFCREKNEEREIWDGFRYGPDAATEIFGFDEAHPISAMLGKSCPTWRPTGRRCSRRSACSTTWDQQVTQLLNEVRNRARTGVAAPDEVVDVRGALDAMRLIKDAHELEPDAPRRRRSPAPRTAARWNVTRPGWYEYQVEAELLHEFLRNGAQAVAYPSIVASGPNACVLHYRDNNRADGRRRPAADRRRLRIPGLRVGHHAHVSGERQVHRAAEGHLRARARVAARVPRRR